jgi:hypothetical protein
MGLRLLRLSAGPNRRQAAHTPPGWSGRVRYRLGQFLRGWRAAVPAADLALVQTVLPPPAAALFGRMPRDAQAHSLRVLKELQVGGAVTPDLAAAALLHDVGKVAANDAGAYLGLWLRGPLVLLEAWRPDWLAAWASPTPARSPRYALYVHLEHPQIGAQWAAAAGCSAAACWLIAHHQDAGAQAATPQPQSTQWQHDLARLQWADGRN